MRKVLIVIALVVTMQAVFVATASAAGPAEQSGGFYHTVYYGQTLSSIGRMYGVNAYTICSVNGLYNCNFIYAGQRLWIPGYQGGYPPTWGGNCVQEHVVSYGETLSGISVWYGVNMWNVAQRNNIANINHIYAGQWLCMY